MGIVLNESYLKNDAQRSRIEAVPVIEFPKQNNTYSAA
jgi:hypothetical protein